MYMSDRKPRTLYHGYVSASIFGALQLTHDMLDNYIRYGIVQGMQMHVTDRMKVIKCRRRKIRRRNLYIS